MSGIVGIVNLDGAPVDRLLIEKLTRFMAYRGPDAQAIWTDGNVGFGHTLLQIDSTQKRESQPFTLGDGVWITADARIDGRAKLTQQLADNNPNGSDAISDAEWILRAYRRWDTDCLEYLLGDFAFAIWDRPKRRLFCARDHFGVKPFYFAEVGRSLIFSNTLDCIRHHPAVSTGLNELAVADFLLFGHNPQSSTTTFADIERLAPAHALSCVGACWKTEPYWSLRVSQEIRYATPDQYIDRFKELLTDAVDNRLRATRGAIYMSGGLDSPALAAAAHSWAGAQETRVNLTAYCLAYDRMPDDERYFSSIAAQALAIPIEHMAVDDYNLFERWGEPALCRPEPFDWPLLAVNHDSLTQVAARSRTVLYGEDPDTLLAPASLTTLLKWTHPWRVAKDLGAFIYQNRRRPPLGLGVRAKLNRFTGRASPNPPYPPWLNPDFARRNDLLGRWKHGAPARASADGVIRPEAHRRLASPLWERLFEFNDPGATKIPVEYSYPYLDLRLVTFMLALPTFPWCVDKYLIRAALRGIMPAAISERPKTPLAFDPYRQPLQRASAKWIDHFITVHRLNEYVIRGKIPPVTGANYDANESWLHLRPLLFNEWIKTARL